MKINILANDLKKGGLEKVLVNSINYFQENNNDINLILLNKDIKYKLEKNKNLIIDHLFIDQKKIKILKLFLNFNSLKKKLLNLNHLMSHHDLSNYLNIIFAKLFLKHKSIIIIHTNPLHYFYNSNYFIGLFKYLFHFFLQLLLYRHADQVIVISNDLKHFVKKKLFIKSQLIYNPIIKHIFDTNPNMEHNINYSKKFLSIGTLTKRKNHIGILKIFLYLKNNNYLNKYKLTLDIIGQGPEYLRLKKFIEKNKLSSFVSIKKNVETLDSIYKKAYCLISFSKLEGLPNIFIESQSFQLPVISCNLPGAFEALYKVLPTSFKFQKDKFIIADYGLIFNKKDDYNLFYSIKFLLENELIYNNLKENMLNINDKFSYKNNYKYIEIINKLIN